MSNDKFYFTEEQMKELYSEGKIMKTGLEMNTMEGIWLAWETEPEAVAEVLPPVLQPTAPIVMSYIINGDTRFAGEYHEAALMLLCSHQGKPGAYLQSLLLEGPGAPQAEYLGREMAGMPKKLCDDVSVSRADDTVTASIRKDGIDLLDATVELGEYNTPAGNEIFAGNIPGKKIHGGFTYLIKYNLEQAEDGHIYFENGRLLSTESDTLYESWTPGSATVSLHECENAPWASLPVKQVLAAGYGKYSMTGFTTEKVCDIDIDENIRYLLKARFDNRLFD